MRFKKQELIRYKKYLAQEYPICQRCGGKLAQDLHHVVFGRYGADKDDRTMIAICRECHDWCHKNKKESIEQLRQTGDENWYIFQKELKRAI